MSQDDYGTERADAQEDFDSEAFAGPGFEISPGFVDATLERVVADQREIEIEAARVEEITFPRELLACYAVPISDDFVERTAARSTWRSTLDTYQVPPVTADFVDRTLAALRLGSAARMRVLQGTGTRGTRIRRWSLAAAAVLVAGLVLVFAVAGGRGLDGPVVAQLLNATSPAPWSTALAERDSGSDLRLVPYDHLSLVAARADRRGD